MDMCKPTRSKILVFIAILFIISIIIIFYIVDVDSNLPFRMFDRMFVSCNIGDERDSYTDCAKTIIIYPNLIFNLLTYYLVSCLLVTVFKRK